MRRLTFSLIITLALATTAAAQKSAKADTKTVVGNPAAKRMLLGAHRLSLQWISWDYFGKALVTEKNGTLYVKGEQRGRGNGDYVTLDGRIRRVDAKEFTFDGDIITRVSHINHGEPCKRSGEMTFRITGNRRYWRLQQMNNPCDEAADYVDIYFR
ncbi:MAG TPA: hypothetical protein VKA60_17475 [Blastocatellia bacterium]|nr:hypothetical protein [Blastocatellia bacterium]